MAEGQYTGKTKIYLYTADDAKVYLLRRDETLGDIEQCGLAAAATSDLDKPEIPKRLKPRYVNWEGELDGEPKKKRLICNKNAPAYVAVGSTAFNIDGSTKGGTTGRVGEKMTFLRIEEEGGGGTTG